MTWHYYDPADEADPSRLPDLEVFYADKSMVASWNNARGLTADGPIYPYEPGWYFWTCLPGCLPDSEPDGPFDSERDALDEARSMFEGLSQ